MSDDPLDAMSPKTVLEAVEMRRRLERRPGISRQQQPQIPEHQTVAMNAVGVGPEPDLRRPFLQSQKCLNGEHEAQASEVRFGNFYGEQTVALICKYCRCLYVEKA